MCKPLSEMSLKELWELFPIFPTEHRECWEDWYLEEQSFLKSFLPSNVKIYHIGSTAIKGIWAKPIIDILVETTEDSFEKIKRFLLKEGYLLMSESKNRVSFNKGYTPKGFDEKVFHLHLRTHGDNDELYFRNYLRENAEVSKEYEKLKLSLWKQYENDRDGYAEMKTSFIKKVTALAKEKYGEQEFIN